jgi:YbgC/YbaW family acyl-CoA thioester hydrolase
MLQNKKYHALFRSSFTSRMHDIDAAGVMFFAKYYYYAHDAYETYLNKQDLSISQLLKSNVALPIKYSSANFIAPIMINEEIIIEIETAEILETEFTLNYLFSDQSGKSRAELISRHVCINYLTKKRVTLPKKLLSNKYK